MSGDLETAITGYRTGEIQVTYGDQTVSKPIDGDMQISLDEQGELTVVGTHVSGEPVKENEVPPTCTEAGHYDEVVYCDICGEELSREQVEVPSRHTYSDPHWQWTGCRSAEAVFTCVNNDDTQTRTAELTANGPEFTATVTFNEKPTRIRTSSTLMP